MNLLTVFNMMVLKHKSLTEFSVLIHSHIFHVEKKKETCNMPFLCFVFYPCG